MTAYLFAPLRFQPLDGNGTPYPAAKLRFMGAGTSTPLDAYADSTLATPLAYPIVANSDGKFPAIYLSSLIAYRAVLRTSAEVLIDDIDPISIRSDVPAGTVVLFMGTSTQRDAAYPTALWQLCDGTNGSYDTRDRALIGAGGTYATGDALGSATGTTSSQADHNHGGVTGSTAADLLAHTHFVVVNSEASGTAIQSSNALSVTYGNNFTGGDTQYYLRGAATTPTYGLTSSAGSGGGHTHTITAGGGHSHTVATVSPGRALWHLFRKT